MTVDFVSAASAESTSLTLPAHQAGDFIAIMARGDTVTPTLPSGQNWIQFTFRTASSHFTRLAYKIANSSSEQSGTWTNANALIAIVLRHATELVGVTNAVVNNGTANTSITYSATTSAGNTGKAILFGVVNSNSTTLENAPSGFTLRNNLVGVAAVEAAVFDSDAQVSVYNGGSVALNGTASFHAYTLMLHATGAAKAGAASFRPVNIRGGADQ